LARFDKHYYNDKIALYDLDGVQITADIRVGSQRKPRKNRMSKTDV